LVRRPDGKRPFGRPRRTGKNNIKMNLYEVRWENRHWLVVAQDRGSRRASVNAVMNLRVP
jgi:hypothetical protein